jgi:hypothetical protein
MPWFDSNDTLGSF